MSGTGMRTSSRAYVACAPTRTMVTARRCLRALVQTPTNGAAAKEAKIFRTVEVDGVKYVSVSQAKDFVFDKEPEAVMQSDTVKLLQQKLDQVQDSLKGKEAEIVKLRKDAMEQDRSSRKQIAAKRDMEEELGTLRMKISSATDGAKKATAQAESAMQVAREEVQTEFSQKYLKSRDSQLAKMSEAVEVAMKKVEAAESAAVQRARAADAAVVEAASSAADKVGADAADAIALARARVDVAQRAALATQESAREVQAAQLETMEAAQRMFSEATAAADRAAAAHGECAALQEEVSTLRQQVAAAVEQRDSALRQAAEKQAAAVRHIRTTHEMCEHRVQEAQNRFEELKLAERDGARRARDDTEQATRRCQELEERERELLRNQGSMQEALAQLGARAEAAEQKLETRQEEMRAEYDELMALLRTNSAASLKVAQAKATDEARQVAQDMIDSAQEEREKATAAAVKERQNLEQLLDSIKEELEYWQRRAARTEAAHAALQSDVVAMARTLPDNLASMQLAVEGKLTRTLIERTAEGMDAIVALDEEWLPPLEEDSDSEAAAGQRAAQWDKAAVKA
eukprot:jgi/Ulvmu1/1382/UM011_0110.1